ncbi:MAG TPA: serine/threonine-protein kinase [Thermoanaerobaculia bacterium]|nr:serine/threonine-protein kinase [Thermoanaerobaculia bacterium]
MKATDLEAVRSARVVAGASTPSRPALASLPPDLAREGVRRLRIVAWGLTGADAFFILLRFFADVQRGRPSSRVVEVGAVAVGMALALVMVRLTSSDRLNPRTLLDLGLVFQVLSALVIAVSYYPFTTSGRVGGWSGVAVWVVTFPLVVPNTRGKVVLATIASALMDPLGSVLHITAGVPPPPLQEAIIAYFPTVIAAALGIAISRMVFRISVEASRARELGSYRLVEPLGAGGMGEVWRAEHRMLARPAAIKLIRTDSQSGGSSRDLQRRFEREARATAKLTSPHTVQVYDYGTTEEGTFYYVMELLEGFDLETLIRQFGPLPPERAIHLLHQACLSLAEAHARGFTHRDIKPANIYVCHYGIQFDFVKILDFGLVKAAGGLDAADGTLTAVGTIAGTPGYMSPEMALGREVDSRADIYSLGCVGYWLLTGRPVFEADSAVEILMEHARTPPPRPSERAPGPLPPGLEEILLGCLRKSPDERPQSIEEVAAALEKIAASERWTASRARRWWQEHRVERERSSDEPTLSAEAAPAEVRRVGPAL